MRAIQKINPMARAVVTIAAVVALVSGVTFAALQNTATLTGNSILSTDVNGLLVDSDNNNTFAATDEGFAFNNVNPGGSSDTKTFKLRNSTSNADPLAVNVQITGESPLPAGISGDDITFKFSSNDGDVIATWAQLIPTDGVPLMTLNQNETADVTVTVSLAATVPDGVTIPNFNFTFGDVAPEAPAE